MEHELTLQKIEHFLLERFNAPIVQVAELSSGMFSRVFSFGFKNERFVLRLNNNIHDFKKDIYAFENFSEELPIQEILEYGQFNEKFYFAIMPLCRGMLHNKLECHEAKNVLPEIINIIEKIRNIDVSERRGYGIIDEGGQGKYENWESTIFSFYNHKFPQINIKKLFAGAILDKEIFRGHCKKMFDLFPFCPEEKNLIHGDFGFDNLLIDRGKVVGVIDWAESRYGDFLYDIAWLDFWSNDIEYANEFKKYYVEKNIDVPYFDERILCYRLHIGLHGLLIAAFLEDKQDYNKIERRLQKRNSY